MNRLQAMNKTVELMLNNYISKRNSDDTAFLKNDFIDKYNKYRELKELFENELMPDISEYCVSTVHILSVPSKYVNEFENKVVNVLPPPEEHTII